MEHVITVKDVVIAVAGIGGVVIVLGLIVGFISSIDFSH